MHGWLLVQEVPIVTSKPLPCIGKVTARYQGATAEARINIPAPSTRSECAEELPAIGWLTVGLLAADGFALQVLLHAQGCQLHACTETDGTGINVAVFC